MEFRHNIYCNENVTVSDCRSSCRVCRTLIRRQKRKWVLNICEIMLQTRVWKKIVQLQQCFSILAVSFFEGFYVPNPGSGSIRIISMNLIHMTWIYLQPTHLIKFQFQWVFFERPVERYYIWDLTKSGANMVGFVYLDPNYKKKLTKMLKGPISGANENVRRHFWHLSTNI